jgi:hypothetical protein
VHRSDDQILIPAGDESIRAAENKQSRSTAKTIGTEHPMQRARRTPPWLSWSAVERRRRRRRATRPLPPLTAASSSSAKIAGPPAAVTTHHVLLSFRSMDRSIKRSDAPPISFFQLRRGDRDRRLVVARSPVNRAHVRGTSVARSLRTSIYCSRSEGRDADRARTGVFGVRVLTGRRERIRTFNNAGILSVMKCVWVWLSTTLLLQTMQD